ncbi:bifunctional ADP-dependent (S)-NAD(P)H-hydrate dehydratase/NAD(P)H-hydrate epimerase [Acinetobacter sp. NCu2D-2]|uniref:bifunctional ADP-dependent NAD(P)H-hydrate dehydratase/NAD(P)H-hydrate epimerase n=1 Tax=Acinetobacter sp. NCu2D-2 TaxID=1608473 RepID=UPI0007CDF46E|nr:bifunctional ADP-dependent NAD(P)H-hydrate dehydratase/NAD(P)H-hydrate epimerase [Acinetobacter sp. NCu2D-2]ANF82022.1 bifunctional ADP-dependent (S)-NAD(P)H-hydrate dehydratase/NAD(P)H-hydrate epimerase [Acinetobacter sp. NCu2D-2]
MQQRVYHSKDIQAWEQRWFAQQNSSYGLMQQVAWLISNRLIKQFETSNFHRIAVCCGAGNNAGDGYLIAKYLKQHGFEVEIYASSLGQSSDLNLAYKEAQQSKIKIYPHFNFQKNYDVYIDALFGIGLNRPLSQDWQQIIQSINEARGFKVSVDLPSGLNANTGRPMPICIQADQTYTVLGFKAGLFTGLGKQYAGHIDVIDAIPADAMLQPLAYLSPHNIHLPMRKAFGHKGTYGHVLVIGGHGNMGGAVIMAAEAAFASGAGKVTVICDAKHHIAILSRAPNIMLADINTMSEEDRVNLLKQVDAVCFGMGLGRDQWAQMQYETWFKLIQQSNLEVVLDADALWFLAQFPQKLNSQTYCTPHPGEAATLLGLKTSEIESDRIAAIYALQDKYVGQWVLKGSGSLTLEDELYICTAGNAGMGTGGMGDVLAGMIASLKAQFHQEIALHQVVTLHALAGDDLAKHGERGLQAQDMKHAIYKVVNSSN